MEPKKKNILLYFFSLATFFMFFAQDQALAQQYCRWEYSSPVNFAGLCTPNPPSGNCTCGTPSVKTECINGQLINPGYPTYKSVATCETYNSRPDPIVQRTPYLIVCPASADITIGETLQLEARYFFDEISRPSCSTYGGFSLVSSSASWQSSNSGIATVSNSGTKGLVTGIDLGTATVTARYGGLSASSNISVVRPPLLLVCPSSTTLDVGETRNFVARYWDSARSGVTTCATLGSSDVTRSADWSSDNADIATIGNDCNFMCRLLRSGGNKGVLTGVNSGNTQANASHNGLVATADVTVSGSVVGSPITVNLTSDKAEVGEGGTINLEWTTTGNPERCVASTSEPTGGWTGEKDKAGSIEGDDVTVYFDGAENKTFTLECSKTGVDSVSRSVTVTKLEPVAKELTVKRGTCSSGESLQFNLSEGETAILVACDEDDDTEVTANWTSENTSCISLESTTPSETMTIEAVGTNPPCYIATTITASATGYEKDSIPVGINSGTPVVPGPKPAQPPVWKEVAP